VADTNYSLILMKMIMGPLSEGIGMVKISSDGEDELPSYAVCNIISYNSLR
jgi:hypothetical protein